MKLSYDALYANLLLDLCEVDGYNPFSDTIPSNPKHFACHSLKTSFFKKLKDRSSKEADSHALEKFLASDNRCKNWELNLTSWLDELMLGNLRDTLYQFFNPGGRPLLDSLDEICEEGAMGPGASINSKGSDFYTKVFSSVHSSTSSILASHFRDYLSRHPSWEHAISAHLSNFDSVKVVEGSRLHFVPKNADISRCICIEPSLNMFYQKGVGSILQRRLYSFFGIDLSKQPDINKIMAKSSSIDGRLATIDLSSASDSISMAMLKVIMPADQLSWLTALRSPNLQLPDGSSHQLSMISSQGNGFTFPLETVIFSCVVSAVYKTFGIETERSNSVDSNLSCFGDDILCLSQFYKHVVRLLNILGFEVNTEKSFHQGAFRESCGGDFLHGRDVRGVYLKSLLTQGSRYVAINRLNKWSVRQGILLTRTISYLCKRVDQVFVPLAESDDAGIQIPLCLFPKKIKRNKNLSLLYRSMVPITRELRISNGSIKVPRGMKPRVYNPHGLLVSFLGGYVKSAGNKDRYTISVRSNVLCYRPKWSVTPNWDFVPKEIRWYDNLERVVHALSANLVIGSHPLRGA